MQENKTFKFIQEIHKTLCCIVLRMRFKQLCAVMAIKFPRHPKIQPFPGILQPQCYDVCDNVARKSYQVTSISRPQASISAQVENAHSV